MKHARPRIRESEPSTLPLGELGLELRLRALAVATQEGASDAELRVAEDERRCEESWHIDVHQVKVTLAHGVGVGTALDSIILHVRATHRDRVTAA